MATIPMQGVPCGRCGHPIHHIADQARTRKVWHLDSRIPPCPLPLPLPAPAPVVVP